MALASVKDVNPISGRRPARLVKRILFDDFALLASVGMDRPNRLPSVFQRRHNRKEVPCWRPVETIEPAKGVQMYGLGTSYYSIHYPLS